MNSPAIVRTQGRFEPADVIGPFDPLAVPVMAWDRAYLVRRLLATGLHERARRIVDAATNPVERHVGQGFLARRGRDHRGAIRHFRKALELDPENTEARIATLELIRSAGVAEGQLGERLGLDLTPLEEKLVAGWQQEGRKAWDELRQLEDDFLSVAPQHPAFAATARLRVAWRLADGSRQRAAEALVILDGVLPLGGSVGDLVTRAEAAGRAGYPVGVSSSILELTRKVGSQDAHATIIRGAIAMLRELPASALSPESRAHLTKQLRARLR
jgi:hypothetical protein